MISSSEAFGFDRRTRGLSDMSARAFIGVLSALVAGGLALAAFIASLTYGLHPNKWWIVGYFALAFPGIFISKNSNNWLASLGGYLLVIIPTGAIIGPYIALYHLASVLQVLMLTVGVTVALGIAGVIYPKSVEHWGGFLLTGLLVLIFADLSRVFMTMFGLDPVTLKAVDYIGGVLFCGFIFYDMNRAVRMDYTLDNAVDAAVALYLDILNLFIRLLAILGKKKD